MRILLKNIKQLITSQPEESGFVSLDRIKSPVSNFNSVLIEEGKIKKIGYNLNLPAEKIIDCSCFIVTPGFVESHTHLVYSGSRADEFLLRAQGVSYKDIAKSGGGIKKSVKSTRSVNYEDLLNESKERLKIFLRKGITSIEIKSGYGLDMETEIKQLKVIRELKKIFKMEIKSTYLGAHEIPEEFKNRRNEYIEFIKNKMIPYIAENELADFIDVFCENGVYTEIESYDILSKGIEYGLKVRLHADEMEYSGGSSVAKRLKAKSVDHFNFPNPDDLVDLKNNGTIITLLPLTNMFLKIKEKPPVELMRSVGNAISISTDFNPGSSPSYSLLLAGTIGMVNYGLTYDELIYAITVNPAYSLDLDYKGSIVEGKDADILLFRKNDYKELFYYSGDDQPEIVILKGEIVNFEKL